MTPITFRCKCSEKCDLYTNGRCVNDPIEYGKPYNPEDILECKLTDLKETAENLGIDPTYKHDNKLKKRNIASHKFPRMFEIFQYRS